MGCQEGYRTLKKPKCNWLKVSKHYQLGEAKLLHKHSVTAKLPVSVSVSYASVGRTRSNLKACYIVIGRGVR